MKILRSVPNVFTSDMTASRRFYEDALGFEVVMDQGWIVTLASPTQRNVQISLLNADPSGLEPALSVEADDVDAAHAGALVSGGEVVYPLRDEPWGVRRFFVREASGTVVNVVRHWPER